jgi:hypothetical protein
MSISEARRQVLILHQISHNEEVYNPEQMLTRMVPHAVEAIVEAIAENRPYDGTLNSIKIPTVILRQILVDANKVGAEEIGLEDLLTSMKARLRNFPDVDNNA